MSVSSQMNRGSMQEIYQSDSSTAKGLRPKSAKKRAKSANIRTENRDIVLRFKQNYQELQQKIATESPLTYQTRVNFTAFIKQANDQALILLQARDYVASTTLLKQSLTLLKGNLGLEHPDLKFTTFNNIAHSHNVQGNQKLCVSNLMKALRHALKMDQDEDQHDIINYLRNKMPVVETYINICNAYSAQGMGEDAVAYISGAIVKSQKLMDIAYLRIQQQDVSQKEKDLLNSTYEKLISFNVLSYKIRGKLFDKCKKYKDALGDFISAKKVIEANYGEHHQQAHELTVCINTTKLHIKHTKGPAKAEIYQEYSDSSSKSYQPRKVLRIRGSISNLRQEPNPYRPSAQSTLENQQERVRLPTHKISNATYKQARPTVAGLRLERQMNSDQKIPMPSYFSVKKERPYSNHRRATHPATFDAPLKNHTCIDYQDQIRQMQELQIQQTKMITFMIQQQNLMQSLPVNSHVPQYPYAPYPMPYYSPYGYPQQMGTAPQYMPPPPPNYPFNFPYGAQEPIPQAQNLPSRSSTLNSQLGSLPQASLSSGQRVIGRGPVKIYEEDKPQMSQIFEHPAASQERKTESHDIPTEVKVVPPPKVKPPSAFLEKFNLDKQSQEPISAINFQKPQPQKKVVVFSLKEQNEAATKIQTHFRRMKAQKEYKHRLGVAKQKIMQKIYQVKLEGMRTLQSALLQASLELPTLQNKDALIHIQVYYRQQMKVIFATSHSTKAFGFGQKGEKTNPSRDEIVVRVQSVIGQLKLTGTPSKDFSEMQLLAAFEASKQEDSVSEEDEIVEQITSNPKHSDEKELRKNQEEKEAQRRKDLEEQQRKREEKEKLLKIAEKERQRKKDEEKAAIKIQTCFRGFKARQEVADLKEFKQSKQKFLQMVYRFKVEDSISLRVGLLTAWIELAWVKDSKNKQQCRPKQVTIQVQNQLNHKIEFSVTHQIKAFGYEKEDLPNRDEVIVRVKSLISLIKLKNICEKDFSEKRFKKAYKHSKIPAAERRDSSSSDEEKLIAKNGQANSRLQPHMPPPKEKSPKKSVKFDDEASDESIIEDIYDSSPQHKKEKIAIEPKKEVIEKTENKNDKKEEKEQKDKKDKKESKKEKKAQRDKKQAPVNSSEYLATLIKVQARIRGFLIRKQYKLLINSDLRTLSTRVKKFKSGNMSMTLLGRRKAPISDNQIAYKIVLRDLRDFKSVHTLPVTVQETKSLLYPLACKGVKLEQQMSAFNKNHHALECLVKAVKMKDEKRLGFFLDFKKFEKKIDKVKKIKVLEQPDSPFDKKEDEKEKNIPMKEEKHGEKPKKKEEKKIISKEETEEKIVKVQALVRGHQVREHFKDQLRAQYKTLSSSVKKMSDQNTFNIFVMGRNDPKLPKPQEVSFKIVFRAVKNLNYVSSIEISFADAQKHLFKHLSQIKDTQQVITSFSKNLKAISCLIEATSQLNGEFSVNYAKFDRLFSAKDELPIMENPLDDPQRYEEAQPAATFMKLPTLSQAKVKIADPDPIRASSPPIESDSEEIAQDTSFLKTDPEEEKVPVIEEKKVSFIKKPTQREGQDLPKALPTQVLVPPPIKEVDEGQADTSLLKTDPEASGDEDNEQMYEVNNESNSLNEDGNFIEEDQDDEEDAPVSEMSEEEKSQAQSADRGISNNQEVKDHGTQVVEAGPLIFMLKIKVAVSGRFIKVDITEQTSKKTIIKDKVIALQPDDEETEVEELVQLFIDAFNENVECLVLDEESEEVQEDWGENLRDFIENEF